MIKLDYIDLSGVVNESKGNFINLQERYFVLMDFIEQIRKHYPSCKFCQFATINALDVITNLLLYRHKTTIMKNLCDKNVYDDLYTLVMKGYLSRSTIN